MCLSQEFNHWIAAHYRHTCIGRAVIHHDDLSDGPCLPKDTFERLTDKRSGVEHGDNGTDRGECAAKSRGKHRLQNYPMEQTLTNQSLRTEVLQALAYGPRNKSNR